MSAVSILRNPKGIVGVLLVLAGIAGLVILVVMLTGTKNDLKSTQVHLDETTRLQMHTKELLDQATTTLLDTQEALSTTETALATTEDTLDDTTASLDRTETTLAATENALASSEAREASLQDDYEALAGDLEAANDRLTRKQHTLDAAMSRIGTYVSEIERLSDETEDLSAMNNDLSAEYQALEEASGTRDMLQDQANELETDIAALHEERAPLIIQAGTGRFFCTASMEPSVTCLDSATWLYNFRPQDVVVGATIYFQPNCREQDEQKPIGAAHRVIDVKLENGTYYYWPQGDGNPEPDGCWVPHTDVERYIIALHKNTVPENAELRGRGARRQGCLSGGRGCVP